MTEEILYNINHIIERDSKSTTYKYALLRGVIDIIQDHSPYIKIENDRVHFPTGLLIEKWILYYYPIFESKVAIPQIGGSAHLAFSQQLQVIIAYYKKHNGLSALYNDLNGLELPGEIRKPFFDLAKVIRDTITKMPMKYIGYSISKAHYSIFNFSNPVIRKKSVDNIHDLITNFGTFSIPKDYYDAFKILGSFINGQVSILFRWAEFSVNASNSGLSVETVMNQVLQSPITQRNIAESKRIYREMIEEVGNVYCVWSGRKIKNYDIDHMIPFSIWRNNDLWNLLPTDPKINNQKRDKIPAPQLIEKRKDLILDYWHVAQSAHEKRFEREIQTALLGNTPFNEWPTKGIEQLKSSCNHLIKYRGFEEWVG